MFGGALSGFMVRFCPGTPAVMKVELACSAMGNRLDDVTKYAETVRFSHFDSGSRK